MEKSKLPGNLYYLIDQFPARNGTYEKLVGRLNEKGLKSNSGKPYTLAIVNNAIRGHSPDERVRLELIAMLNDNSKKPKSKVSRLLKEAEKAMGIISVGATEHA